MRKSVFLDRDGTINEDRNYIYKPTDFVLLPGVIKGLKLLQKAGYDIFIVTNQSGIARGYFKLNDYYELNRYMLSKFEDYGIKILDVAFCPHHPEGIISKYRKDCACRKPKTKMYWDLAKKWDVDMAKSYAIGDKLRDLSICIESKCKGYLLQLDGVQSIDRQSTMMIDKVKIVSTLYQAAQMIMESERLAL